MKTGRAALAYNWARISTIWYRNYLIFQKSWTVSAFWILLEPLFILTALGYGLGSFVNNIDGVSYIDFFFPALICNSAMMVAYFSSTYDNYSKLTYQKLYVTQILTPIQPIEICIGEILWGATKGTMSAVGISIIGLLLGLADSWRILPALGVVFLLSMFFAAMGMVVTTYVKNYDQIIYPTSGLVIPMSLFSGTYFPIHHLPYGLKYLAYIFPLTHAVTVVREMVLKGFFWQQLLHVLALCVFIIYFVRWGYLRLQKKLLS
jgi:lipooligosaccharide transport system permease protein